LFEVFNIWAALAVFTQVESSLYPYTHYFMGASPPTAGSGFPWFRYRSIPERIKNIFHGAKRFIIYKR
jgi:hypothetical protein